MSDVNFKNLRMAHTQVEAAIRSLKIIEDALLNAYKTPQVTPSMNIELAVIEGKAFAIAQRLMGKEPL